MWCEIFQTRSRPAIALAPSFLGKRQIARRVDLLLKEASMSKRRLALSWVVMLAILTGTGRFSASSFPLQGSRPLPSEIADRSAAFERAWARAKTAYPATEGKIPVQGQSSGDTVERFVEGMNPPRPIVKVQPEYTEEARNAKLRGTVVAGVEIWPDGKAHNIQVARGLGMGLNQKAVEAIEQWEFEPGTKDGKPVKVAATIEMNFRLD
jgi:TonB family protein